MVTNKLLFAPLTTIETCCCFEIMPCWTSQSTRTQSKLISDSSHPQIKIKNPFTGAATASPAQSALPLPPRLRTPLCPAVPPKRWEVETPQQQQQDVQGGRRPPGFRRHPNLGAGRWEEVGLENMYVLCYMFYQRWFVLHFSIIPDLIRCLQFQS